MGNQRAVCERRQLHFRHDMNKRAIIHSRIRLRILSCSRMREIRREPEVPEEKVPVVERLDGPCKDYL